MNWYYVEAGKQAGPVEEAVLEEMVRTARITAETLVWREGLANWLPYREAKPGDAAGAVEPPVVAPPPAAGPASGVICCECGRTFPTDQVIRYADRFVCATCKPVFVQKVKEGAMVLTTAPGTFHYGGFWIRFAAKFLDGLVMAVVLIPLYLLLFFGMFSTGARPGQPNEAFILLLQVGLNIAQIAISLGYNTFMIGKYGATLGKMACGLRVVMADGNRLTYGRALGRAAAEILSGLICYIGYIIAGFDNEKRALHDHMAATRVVYK
jgi:uncharacterized RDD family membrane protein YckC